MTHQKPAAAQPNPIFRKRIIGMVVRNPWQVISLILGLCLLLLVVQFMVMRNRQAEGVDTNAVIGQLGKILDLSAEKPQVIPISNAGYYQNAWPDFYKNAKSGDVLIQYNNASLLFDPDTGKIVNFYARGVYSRPKPADVLKIALRFNGYEQYRTLLLKRQIEEDLGNSAYQIIEVAPSKVLYKDDAVYILNTRKEALARQFAKDIGGSPVFESPEPGEASTSADIIVSFRSML